MPILNANKKSLDGKPFQDHNWAVGVTWKRRKRNWKHGKSQQSSVYLPSWWRLGLDDCGWLFPRYHLHPSSNQVGGTFFLIYYYDLACLFFLTQLHSISESVIVKINVYMCVMCVCVSFDCSDIFFFARNVIFWHLEVLDSDLSL